MGKFDQDPDEEALNRILGDMDSMEGKSLNAGGATITISIQPNGGGEGDGGEGEEADALGGKIGIDGGPTSIDDFPEGHDASMCEGGCVVHKGLAEPKGVPMADGGVVSPVADEAGEKSLPPFLRKKKKPLSEL